MMDQAQVIAYHAAAFAATHELIASSDRAAATRYRQAMEEAEVHAKKFLEAIERGSQEIERLTAESVEGARREIAAQLCRAAAVARSSLFVEVARTMSSMIADGQKLIHLVERNVTAPKVAGKDNDA